MLIACGSTNALPDAGPENIDGCWVYVAGAAKGQLQISGRSGTFTMTGGPVDHGQLLHTDEADGSIALMFYCQESECGVLAPDGGIVPSDAGGTRFLLLVVGDAMAAATTSTGQEFSATRCQ